MIAPSASIRFASARKTALVGLALLVAACDNPFSGDENTKAGPSNPDSMDAELGKNRLNRYDFLQGKFLSTGQAMDLAIEGKGLFVMKNQGQYVFFRRPGMFTQDAEGYLHLGNAKTRLQGIRLYSDANPWPRMPSDSAVRTDLKDLQDVRWPFDDLAPPRATTVVKLARNLDSEAAGKGSILYTQKFMHHAEGAPNKAADLLIGLFDKNGTSLGIKDGDILTLSASKNGSTVTAALAITAASTVKDLTLAMQDFLRGESVGAGLETTVDVIAAGDRPALSGAISIYANAASIANFQITSNRPVSGPNVTKVFSVPTDIPAGTVRFAVVTEPLRAPARATDLLAELFDSVGNPLGLEEGDLISYSGAIGNDQAQSVTPTAFAAGSTTLQNMVDKLRDNFKLPERDGSLQDNLSVSLNAAGTDDNIADGSIVIRGQPLKAFDIRDVTIRSTDKNNTKPSPNFFNTNMNITTLRSATDDLVGLVKLDIHDATGKAHPVTLSFTPRRTPGNWQWDAVMEGASFLIGPTRGTLRFGADGSVSHFTGTIAFDPGNGAPRVLVDLTAGGPGDFTGLTQFRSPMTVAAVSQDGFAPGRLTEISIGEDGVISGAYSNGQSRPLFQLPLAGFPNPGGLRQVGENSFLETLESGKPTVSVGLDPAGGSIRSGAVEYVTDAERVKVCDVFPGC